MSNTPEQAYVEEQARQILYRHPHLNSMRQDFDFKYEERVLTIKGKVPTFHLKQLLQTALRKLDGVERVDNRVSVEHFKLST
jgi:hypothetical protein